MQYEIRPPKGPSAGGQCGQGVEFLVGEGGDAGLCGRPGEGVDLHQLDLPSAGDDLVEPVGIRLLFRREVGCSWAGWPGSEP
jgi:hypothetical protein